MKFPKLQGIRPRRLIGVALALVLVAGGSATALAAHYGVDELGTGWNCALNSHAYIKASSGNVEFQHKRAYEGSLGVDETEWSGSDKTSYSHAPDDTDQNVSKDS